MTTLQFFEFSLAFMFSSAFICFGLLIFKYTIKRLLQKNKPIGKKTTIESLSEQFKPLSEEEKKSEAGNRLLDEIEAYIEVRKIKSE